MARRLNGWIFVKNGYSPLKHVFPFAVAALLLLTLSVPADNLLLKLAGLLGRSGWSLLPALLLTAAATVVYVLTVWVQVRKAHLWSDRELLLTVTTSATYLVLCALMAFVVLHSATPTTTLVRDLTLGNVWACSLVAVLSLTGVGWSVPGSWVDSVGVKSPDYDGGRSAATRMIETIGRVRGAAAATEEDAQELSTAASDLNSSIEDNLAKEPDWARGELQEAGAASRAIAERTDAFLENGPRGLADFKVACHCQQRGLHEEFVGALDVLGRHWPGLRCG